MEFIHFEDRLIDQKEIYSLLISLKYTTKPFNKQDPASPNFSDCIGCLTENQFYDSGYRIVFDPSFTVFENNCPYIV